MTLLLMGGCSSAGPRATGLAPATGFRLDPVAIRLESPVHLAAPAGDPRLFVVEQAGRIRIVEDDTLRTEPFLDISDRVTAGGEQGLLSVAFHPSYAQNGFFYVNYTDLSGDTRIERYRVSADPYVADPQSAHLILGFDQPYSNHNGGLTLFGPDGMLWIGTGDGGSGGDPEENAQNRASLLGKMLRIDVDGGDPYAIPPDNPFVGRAGVRPEIWALGLRNPWRYAIDPVDGLLYIGDVGQNRYEEIDVVPVARAGLNFGWDVMEGTQCFEPARCDTTGLVQPVVVYGRSAGCSITGGVVYRGADVPSLVGHYVYADYCSGWIRSFRMSGGAVTDHRQWRLPEWPQVSSFGVDGRGELYVVAYDGKVYRVAFNE
jgi:glucose/arabinose dehydrogenase